MRTLRVIGLIIAALAFSACASQFGAQPREMKTCVEGAAPVGVETRAFSAALRQAQRYSERVYGADCFVCAEVFDEPGTYMLHITSPIADMLINTSAAITVRKSDGAVVDRAIWHSCHARIRKTARSASDDVESGDLLFGVQETPNYALERTVMDKVQLGMGRAPLPRARRTLVTPYRPAAQRER
jgi:hypothetical protein